MIKNIVVITTILEPQRTIRLAKSYLSDPSTTEVFIYDNGHDDYGLNELKKSESIDSRLKYVDTRGLSLHGQWNKALKYAADNVPSNIILSNDDIVISDFLVTKLSEHIRSNDNFWIAYPANKKQFTGVADITPTKGTKADGGMDGSCFMVKGESFNQGLPYIDERFVYWGGDDDLVKNVEKMNKIQIRINEVWSDHQESSTSSSPGFEWMQKAVASDRELLKEKWGIIR
jgi:GT2 family glycosyltransferase